ncbi:hypothetical protein [Paraburkholderia youngii]|uniref:hypothetical protein n=1 Tax=Paraburkholderia youngii TaxID=2782701 RepID=UPI003D200701
MAKFTFTNNSFTDVGTAFKVSADVDLSADSNVFDRVGTVLEVQEEMPESLKRLIAAVEPFGATPAEICDALLAVRNAPVEDQERAVESTGIWSKIKGRVPDAVALFFNAAVEYAKLKG